jgi:ParB family chromosome partitioning protein
MTTRRSPLGRGIGALLPGASSLAEPVGLGAAGRPGPAAPEIPVDAIDPNPDQPRRRFDPEDLEQLAGSIERHGVLQPVVLRRAGDRYELVVGERRWRAARAAGLASLPAVVADVDPRERLELALVENIQRRDLNPMELAHAFRALAENGATQEEIGQRVGLDQSSVANHIRLLGLPREIQEDVESGRLTTGHAKALLQVSSPERQRHLRDRILRDGLPVRAAEELARSLGGAVRRVRRREPRAAPDPNLQRVVDSLRQRLQTRVRVQGDARRGRIEIEYFGDEDLQRIAKILLGDA